MERKVKLFILAIALSSCEATEIPQPIKATKLTKIYTIQPQIGSVFNPTYSPNLGK